MNCTVVYGLGSNIKHRTVMSVAEAFRFIRQPDGWLFYNIYYNGRLVYTTQGVAGYRYICEDCPYRRK